MACNGEGGGAAACSGGRRGRRRRGRARGVEAGAAKTRWHGAGDGGAPVSGLAGSSSKAAGAWRRRSSGGARGRRRSRRRDGRDDGGVAQISKMPMCWRKAEVERHI